MELITVPFFFKFSKWKNLQNQFQEVLRFTYTFLTKVLAKKRRILPKLDLILLNIDF